MTDLYTAMAFASPALVDIGSYSKKLVIKHCLNIR
jgi:hypothetical protein